MSRSPPQPPENPMVDRPPLRLVQVGGADDLTPLRAELEAVLRLLHTDRGAIVSRPGADAPVAVESSGLSPEEEAACRSLARRAWQHSVRGGYLAGTLGDNTLLARPLDGGVGESALVAFVRRGGGKIDAER